MKTKSFLLFVIFGMLFVSCKQEQDLSEYMVTNWQTAYIKIEMPTAYGKDSLQVYEDDFSKNNATIAQSTYLKDGTFKAWYVKPDGTKAGESDGKWNVKGDSLFIEYIVAGKLINPTYFIEKTEEGLLAKSKHDWDNDGEFDDILTMKSKKIKVE